MLERMKKATPLSALLATAALGLLIAPEPACLSHTCSEVGCQDQFSIVVQAASAALPAGTHRIDVTADGRALSCTFELPSSAQSGGTSLATCSPGLVLFVGPAQSCVESTDGNIRSLKCMPIAGQTRESLQLTGTPSAVTFTQSVNGTILLQTEAKPTYKTSQPNGPDCEPTCRQATLELTLP